MNTFSGSDGHKSAPFSWGAPQSLAFGKQLVSPGGRLIRGNQSQ